MTQQTTGLGTGGLGNVPNRSQGLPIVIDNLGFGASATVWADIINLTASYMQRIFTGISIYNPDSSNAFNVAMGAKFNTNKVLTVPKSSSLTLNALSFGPGYIDPFTLTKCSAIRGLLGGATAGTAGAATINYTTPGQPTDGMCVFLNGIVYEFTNNENDGNPLHAAYVQVPILSTAALTWTNLKTIFNLQEQAAVAIINTGTSVLTLTSTYAGVAAGTAFAIADGDAAAANTTGATFNHANLATGAANGTIPVVMIW